MVPEALSCAGGPLKARSDLPTQTKAAEWGTQERKKGLEEEEEKSPDKGTKKLICTDNVIRSTGRCAALYQQKPELFSTELTFMAFTKATWDSL